MKKSADSIGWQQPPAGESQARGLMISWGLRLIKIGKNMRSLSKRTGSACSCLSFLTVEKSGKKLYDMRRTSGKVNGGKMARQQPIILYGNSMLIAGLAINLKNDFEVIKVTDPCEAGRILKTTQPATILVDSAPAGWDWVFVVSCKYPQIPVLVLNPENDAA
jgi:hypothetical protein